MGPRAEGVPPSLRRLLVDDDSCSSFRVRWLGGLLGSLGVGAAADDSQVVGVVGAALEEGGDVVDD